MTGFLFFDSPYPFNFRCFSTILLTSIWRADGVALLCRPSLSSSDHTPLSNCRSSNRPAFDIYGVWSSASDASLTSPGSCTIPQPLFDQFSTSGLQSVVLSLRLPFQTAIWLPPAPSFLKGQTLVDLPLAGAPLGTDTRPVNAVDKVS